MQIVIDIPKEMHKAFVQGSFGAKYNMYDLVGCVMNGTPLSDNATNGDVIKAMFPHHDIEVNEQKNYVHIFYDSFYTTYPLRWWLEPYKAGDTE